MSKRYEVTKNGSFLDKKEKELPIKCKAGHISLYGKPVGENGITLVVYGMFFLGILFGLWIGLMTW